MAAAGGTDTDKVEEYKVLWGAKILWPPDIPDDMLEKIVGMAHEALEKYPEENGQLKEGVEQS